MSRVYLKIYVLDKDDLTRAYGEIFLPLKTRFVLGKHDALLGQISGLEGFYQRNQKLPAPVVPVYPIIGKSIIDYGVGGKETRVVNLSGGPLLYTYAKEFRKIVLPKNVSPEAKSIVEYIGILAGHDPEALLLIFWD